VIRISIFVLAVLAVKRRFHWVATAGAVLVLALRIYVVT